MKKRIISIMIAVTMIGLMLTGCGSKNNVTKNGSSKTDAATEEPAKEGQTVIKIGHVEPEDRSTHRALLDFKKNVEDRTNGDIKIEIYPNGSLGGDVQLSESVAMGTLDAALPSTSVLTTYSDDYGVLDMPYLFISPQAAFNAMDGEAGEYFTEKLRNQGIETLGYTYNGPRSTTTNVRPIEKPEDLKGIKMRVMESPIFIDFYKTLGANPTPMSFTELYTGLQQGTVDAEENPPSLILSNKFYEVQKYLSVDEHVNNFLAFIMNQNKFNSLSTEQQKIIKEEAKKYTDEQRSMELKDNEEAVKKLGSKECGLKVNVFTPEQKEVMKKALKPMYDKYEKQFGKEIFDKCEKYNK